MISAKKCSFNVSNLKYCIFGILVLFANPLLAQVDGGETSSSEPKSELHSAESGGPDYLNPVSNTADLNVLAGIFGDIARAAAGQIELADLVVNTTDDGSEKTDNVISSMMFVYHLSILTITVFAIVVLIALMTIESGKEGAVLTKRYNEWVAIRTLYAVFAMMPVLGGWSIGHYAILSGTFYVNSFTNELNHISSRWVYANGTLNSVDLDPFQYRNLVETVYLNELCAQVNNKKVKDFQKLQDDFIASQVGRIASGNLTEATMAGLNKSIEWLSFRTSSQTVAQNTISVTNNAVGPLTTEFSWGAPSMDPSVCGKAIVDFADPGGELDYNAGIRSRTLESYFEAQSASMEELVRNAQQDIASVVERLEAIDSSVDPIDKTSKQTRFTEEAAANDNFAAFAFAFDGLAQLDTGAIDRVFANRVSTYRRAVSTAYRNASRERAVLFDEMLNELARAQRESGMTDYKTVYSLSEIHLDPRFKGIAGPEVESLLLNTTRGWLFSGYKWWDLSKAQTEQYSLQKKAPQAIAHTQYLSGVSDLSRTAINNFTQTYETAKSLRRFTDYNMVIDGETVTPSPNREEFFESVASMGDKNQSFSAFMEGFGPWMTKKISGALMENYASTDLLTNLQSAGHKYLLIGESLLLLKAGMSVSAAVIKEGGGWAANAITLGGSRTLGAIVSATLRELAAPVGAFGMIFIIVGFIYAIYLPLLPAMVWTFGVIGWLEKLISLIIIFPIWMFGHIFPDGDGFVNSVGRQGYSLLGTVLFRPPVMVLALHFSMAALGAVGFIIGHILEVVLPGAHSGYITGIGVGIGSFVVISGFMVVICHMIIGWTYKIPDEIGHYIGASGGNYGEAEGKGHVNAIAGLISSHSQTILNGGGGNHQKREGKSGAPKTKQRVKHGSMGA